jgi:sortase A
MAHATATRQGETGTGHRAAPRPRVTGRGHPIARATGALALVAALVGAGVLVWQLWWTDVQAAQRSETLVSGMRQDFGSSPAQAQTIAVPAQPSAQDTTTGAQHQPAIVHLPTIGEELPVLDGVGADVLDQGVLGRYPGSGAPGEVGNYAVAGHRTTYGRPLWALDEIDEGDPVVVETADAFHVYRLTGTRVTHPDDVSVLAPVPDHPGTEPHEASMVLTTCHPRFSAEQRLIGYAVLDRSVARSAGLPPELEERARPD